MHLDKGKILSLEVPSLVRKNDECKESQFQRGERIDFGWCGEMGK